MNRADGDPMTRVNATTWTLALAAQPDTAVADKIVLNPLVRGADSPRRSDVERGAGCTESANRTLRTSFDGDLRVAVTVANWRSVGGC